jgi:hypothetical protein
MTVVASTDSYNSLPLYKCKLWRHDTQFNHFRFFFLSHVDLRVRMVTWLGGTFPNVKHRTRFGSHHCNYLVLQHRNHFGSHNRNHLIPCWTEKERKKKDTNQKQSKIRLKDDKHVQTTFYEETSSLQKILSRTNRAYKIDTRD